MTVRAASVLFVNKSIVGRPPNAFTFSPSQFFFQTERERKRLPLIYFQHQIRLKHVLKIQRWFRHEMKGNSSKERRRRRRRRVTFHDADQRPWQSSSSLRSNASYFPSTSTTKGRPTSSVKRIVFKNGVPRLIWVETKASSRTPKNGGLRPLRNWNSDDTNEHFDETVVVPHGSNETNHNAPIDEQESQQRKVVYQTPPSRYHPSYGVDTTTTALGMDSRGDDKEGERVNSMINNDASFVGDREPPTSPALHFINAVANQTGDYKSPFHVSAGIHNRGSSPGNSTASTTWSHNL